jgi:hypothetical protein
MEKPMLNRSYHAKARDSVSNGSRIHVRGVDLRKKSARRFRDILANLTVEMNGADLTEADRALLRTAATLIQKSEGMQADSARGLPVEEEALTRLANVLSRCLAELKARAKPAREPSMAEYIRQTSGAPQ